MIKDYKSVIIQQFFTIFNGYLIVEEYFQKLNFELLFIGYIGNNTYYCYLGLPLSSQSCH